MAKSRGNLHNILNSLEQGHKRDMFDITAGHLNESRMNRLAEVSNRRPWGSAAEQTMSMVDRHIVRIETPKRSEKEKKMKDVMYDFTMGTTGSIPVTQPKREQQRRYPPHPSPASRQEEQAATRSTSPSSQLEDGVYIEELRPQEMLLPTPRSQRSWTEVDEERRGDATPQSVHKDRNLARLEHVAVSNPYYGVTKKDQYYKMKDLQTNVLRTHESTEQKVLSGVKAVEHLQNRLEIELSSLNFDGIGPNFHKLQVFSNIFDDLIHDSPTFNFILKNIKTEYDNYISRLLDGQTSQHRLLQDQVEQMTHRGTSRPKHLQLAKDKLLDLENEARRMLEENERLRHDVKFETELEITAPEPEAPKTSFGLYRSDPPVELAEEIEHVKALILEKIDELTDLKSKLRDEFVPSTVCTHLEQCIKETQVEVQKLLKQNEYFERSISEMEDELKEDIITADTSERDARRIWRRVNSKRPLGSARSTKSFTTSTSIKETLYESDEDEDDESKWNWYIS